ncbi:MAG: hypothetical protein JW915_23860 [Chitinispirillaceae bacterium]|nr:hypothetical protein [Chitinispirillaceae bacterium]
MAQRMIMAALFLSIVPCSAISATVLSGMELISGSRGTILSLRSDNPINCIVSTPAKTLVKIVIPGCVYGLEDFSYSKFENESPVNSIMAVEKKDGSGIVLTVSLKSNVGDLPVVKIKDRDTYILISKSAGNTFSWKAASVLKPVKVVTKREQGEKNVVNAKDVSRDSAGDKGEKNSTGRLIDIAMVYREQVCRINFKFSGNVAKDVYRNRDSLICMFSGAENGMEKKSFDLFPQTVYRKVLLLENKKEKKVIAKVIIDSAAFQSIVNIVFEDSSLLTIMALNKESSYNAFWNAHSGTIWEHELTYVKPFEVDLKKLRERAEKDVGVNFPDGPVFRVGDFYSGPPEKKIKQSELVENSIKQNQEGEDTASGNAAEITQNTLRTDLLNELNPDDSDKVVINADEVNIRRRPTVNSPAIAKAMKGMRALRKKTDSDWTQVTINGSTGWIKNQFILSPETVREEKKAEIDPVAQTGSFRLHKNEGNIQTSLSSFAASHDSIAIQKVSQLLIDDIVLREESDALNDVIHYKQNGRDPFIPLIKDSLLQRGKASLEQLLLVGVLIDGGEKVALFEDKGNKKFALTLRESDAVENGKLLKIFPDRVVFLLTEFGISRSFTLHLKNSNMDQEARAR